MGALSPRHGLGLASFAAAAWAVLLARYGREEDVVFGLVESGSLSLERIRVRWDADAVTWMREQEGLRARRRDSGPIDLDRIRAWSEVPEGLPLLESVVVAGSPADGPSGAWPLIVGVEPGSRLELWVDAAAERFDEWTLGRVLAHLELALRDLAAEAPPALGDIDIIEGAERERLLVEWNRTAVDHRTEATIAQLFAEQVAARPEAPAVVSDSVTLSYRELDVRTSRLARHLQRLGVKPGMPVGLCLERSSELVEVVLGILKAGGAYLPLDHSHPVERLRFTTADAGASMLVTRRDMAGRLATVAEQVVVIEDLAEALAREDPTAPEAGATARSLAYIAYTSGSTGTPKGAAIQQRAVNRLVRAVDYVALGPDTVTLHAAPLAFDASTFEIWAPLLNGGCCVIYTDPVITARGLAACIERHRVNTLWLTSSLFNALVDESPECLRGVCQLLTGGEALSVSHVRRALAALPETRLFNGYGPTECTTFTTVHPIPRDLGPDTRSIPIGRPIRDTRVYVLDERRRLVPTGVAGELYVGGEGLAKEYVNRPELTAERFVPDPFGGPGDRLYRTGDLVRWRPEGVLDYIGRIDAQVKIRGFRIEPGEVEAVLTTHPAVGAVIVLPREDRPGVKRLVAYLVARAGQEAPRPGALREFVAPALPEFMVPSAFVWLDVLPLNANGKVDVGRLPAPPAERPDLDVEFVGADRVTEMRLLPLFEDAVGVSGLGIRDNFFDLGGNSLLAVKLIARLRREIGAEIPIVEFFRQPTIEAVARLVDRGGESSSVTLPEARSRPVGGSELDGVAIVGMGGRFPGAQSVAELWKNLCDGLDTISHFASAELDPSLEPALTGDPAYVRSRGVLKDVEMFDAAFFGISPKEAEVMDPQQRLFLEVAWEVLEEAGYVREDPAVRVGVYGGMYNATYFQKHVATRPDLVERVGAFQVMVANEKDYVTTRVAHKLNLTGPAVSIHTACSTSLVAVVEAFHSLRRHECDLALAGGAAVTCPPRSGYLYQEGAMLSPDGHTRAFDAAAQGTVFSDGVSMLLLKRLGDALADRDTVYGVIRGAAVNNDGGVKASFTAPSVDGQAAVVRAAQEVAGVDARSISYVETHGTATPLGDPIEVEALTRAFRAGTMDRGFCAIGSIKSNIGHTVIAAGGAGLIKTALALSHRRIPPSLHYHTPNPQIDFDSSPFYVNATLADWPSGPTPRRAGVSAFGVGGTNAHVVVEEAPEPAASSPSRPQKLLLLSARTPAALDAVTARLREHLAAHPGIDLADVAWTLMVGRREFTHRRAIVASGVAEAVALLGGGAPTRVFTRKVESAEPEVAFLFPGQGAQYAGMGAGLHRDEPTYRAVVDYCAEALRPVLGRDLRDLLFAPAGEAEATDALRRTDLTQPALFVTEYALAQLWMSWGVKPTAMIGHSVGEFVAAVLAGVMSLEDGLRLVAVRGRLMNEQPRGGMLSVRLDAEEAARRLAVPALAIASDNGPGLCVVAGPTEEVAALETALAAEGVACRALQTSHAFHSPMMDAVVEPFARHVRGTALHEPRIPFVSTVTGTWIRPEEATSPDYWARHLRETVRFREGAATLLAGGGRTLLEVGPRATLSTLVRRQAKDRGQTILASLGDGSADQDESAAILQAAGQLWLSGTRLDARAFHVHETRRRVPLPTYPFERKRFWVDPARSAESLPVAPAVAASPAPATPPPSPSPVATLAATSGSAITGAERMPGSPSSIRDALVVRLQDLFEEISGVEFGEGDASATFMELGLDSLSLTQVAQQVQKVFKVKVTFRELMESHTSLETLAARLEEEMPNDLLPTPTPAAGIGAAAPPAPAASPGPVPAGYPTAPFPPAPALAGPAPQWGGLPMAAPPGTMPPPGFPPLAMPSWGFDPQAMWMMMQWYQQQLWAAAQGVRPPTLGAPWAPVAAPAPAHAPQPPAAAPAPAVSAAALPPPEAPKPADEEVPAGQVKYDAKKAFGAIARISTAAEDLTPQQKARLAAFVRRYNARTRGSKEFTQRHRKANADPRVVTGFRPAVKELVYPIVASRSKGAYIWDLDGNQYVDCLNGFGCNYFGWQPDFVSDAVKRQIDTGIEIGPQTPLVAEVAELFCDMTGNERAAFCNTGSEAVMGCTRIARTVTGRSTIAVFSGSYHGIFDEVIVRATKKGRAYPAAPGILPNTAENVLVLDYGTPESLEILRTRAQELAAVLVEPVQSRRPDLQPREFLHEVRKITAEAGTVLIFDEVITGFRTGPHGAQGYFGVQADVGSYGKVVGGGYPVGVIAGKAQYMDALDGGPWQFGDDSVPTVGVTYFAGTFVRHPLALAAMKAVLLRLKEEGPAIQERMNARTSALAQALNREFETLEAPLKIKQFSTLWKAFPVQDNPWGDLLFYMLRDRGLHIYDGFPCFLTTAHTDADVETIVKAFRESVREMQESGFLPQPSRRPTEFDSTRPPVEGARLGRDRQGNPAWYVPSPEQPGQYVKVGG
jgi:amino acid adenylation domain-containing protein